MSDSNISLETPPVAKTTFFGPVAPSNELVPLHRIRFVRVLFLVALIDALFLVFSVGSLAAHRTLMHVLSMGVQAGVLIGIILSLLLLRYAIGYDGTGIKAQPE